MSYDLELESRLDVNISNEALISLHGKRLKPGFQKHGIARGPEVVRGYVRGHLGTTTRKVSGPEKRVLRWRRLRVAAYTLPDYRVHDCMKHMAQRTLEDGKRAGVVELKYNQDNQVAHFHGLAVCASVWTCPVCAAKISYFRRAELEKAVAADYSKFMITFTLQHTAEDSCISLLSDHKKALKRLKSGRWWLEFRERYKLVAYVSSTEITVGRRYGWHPHTHMLVWSGLPAGDLVELVNTIKAELTLRYAGILAKMSHYVHPKYGLDVRAGDDQVGQYVAKWGLADELVYSNQKNTRDQDNLSPFQLLDIVADHRAACGSSIVDWAISKWREYAAATFGRKQLTWSHGARKLFGLGQELEDEDIVKQDEPGETVYLFDAADWKKVVRLKLEPELLNECERVLGNTGKINEFLASKHFFDLPGP